VSEKLSSDAANVTAPVSGSGRTPERGKKIRVAIVGVGNCASSLVQGRYYYENASETDFIPGLMHVNLGGYHVRDIEFVAAFDIDKNTFVFCKVPNLGVKVDRGMTHDGLGKYLSQIIEKAPGPTADVIGILKERKVDVMINYLPVGSEEATKWYVEQALAAGVGVVNCIPVFIAREPYWQRRFAEKGLPIIGDDIKSQVGATIGDDNIHVGPSDHVPWLLDRKYCYIVMEGTTFGDVPLKCEMKLEVWDSPNSAGVVIDAVRCLKLGLDRGLKGALVAPSAYFKKSPPIQLHDDIAFNRVEAFIRGEDNETLVGTETLPKKVKRAAPLRGGKAAAEVK
jgi:myo-inositol-1-phosphate synthase